MPEPINTPDPIADAAELATLRKVNAELLSTKHAQKARIAELESERNALSDRADKAVATMRAAVVDLPLRRMAEKVSTVPELWLAEMGKDYNFEPGDDGSIQIQTKDGKPVTARDGKPLEWSHVGLYNLLAGKPTDDKTERSTVYRTLMRYAGASGAAVGNLAGQRNNTPGKSSGEKEVAPHFGLR